MKSFFKEFRDFAIKGNVMSLAVGVIIGAAFQGVVTSLTENILSPILGLFMRQDFDALQWQIFGVTIKYGAFITAIINFVILALVVFLLVKGMNRLMGSGKKADPQAEPATKECPHCLSSIPYRATRCPHCTAELPPAAPNTKPE